MDFSFIWKALRKIQDHSAQNIFLSDSYEYGSDKPAIEILLGDDLLLDFVHGKGEVQAIQNYLCKNEEIWMNECRELGIGKNLISVFWTDVSNCKLYS